ncbi:hypothetical protein F0L17_25375 [Streptomyces sp. TRM43335]|uniref:Uncharacterized protein n=1 Tax=Streptomyces taklimakanensis TaxID=2569853 RepID=A0A6G2BJY8_9ACTN|nr:DUF6492 family protein [Streptomyces taklimakanensis]MTE22373.1 hypothetical protein [Streptomyces taklimakanensis]
MQADGRLPSLDVLILAAEKDLPGLGACVEGLLAHCRNPIATLRIVSRSRPTVPDTVPGTRIAWTDELRCVPGVRDIHGFLRASGRDPSNASWYFQQLVKLRCFDLLPADAPEHVLVVDADFVLLRDTVFVDALRRSLVPYGYPLSWRLGTREHRLPNRHTALEAASRLVPGWQPVDAYSGMQHHMVFDRTILDDLAERARHAHGTSLWQAFLATSDAGKWTGASEYVLYRHFAERFFPDRIRPRHLRAVDVIQADTRDGLRLSEVVHAARHSDLDAVGCHRFLHYAERLATMDYVPDRLRRALLQRPGPLQLRLDRGLLMITPASRPLVLES